MHIILKSVWCNAEWCGATSNSLILITVPYGFWSGFPLTFLLTHMWNQDICEHFPHRKLASLCSFSTFRPPLTTAQHIPPNHTHLSNPTWPPSMGRNVRLISRGFTNTRGEENDPRNPLTYQRGAFTPPHEHDIRRRSMRWAATRDYIMKWRGNLRKRGPLTEEHLVKCTD